MSLLELYDLDGTLTTTDAIGALEGRHDDEVFHYIVAAAEFIGRELGLPIQEAFQEIRRILISQVFPARAKPEFWGTFPASDGTKIPISPAVDHYLLTAQAVRVFLEKRLQQENPGSEAFRKIQEFLATDWEYPLFKFASDISLPYGHLDDDAIGVLQQRLGSNALAAIFTNSSIERAEALLRKAGLQARIEKDGITRGKIGVMGNAMKFQVDPSLPEGPDTHIDLLPFWMDIKLDLRRRVYREKVEALMRTLGTTEIFMATDIPEIDLYPLRAWFGHSAILAMKTNPSSAPESITAAQALLNAKISPQLSELTRDLP